MTPRTSKVIAWVVAGLLVVTLPWWPSFAQQPASAAAPDTMPAAATPVFARNVAGTWVDVAGGFKTLQNINSDGTLIWSHNFEYGGGTGAFFDGAVYGTWEQTGRYQMRSVEVGFLYDGDGRHVHTGRVSTLYTFASDFQTYTAQFWEDLFAPNQDPTDPTESPVTSFGGTFAAQRVTMAVWNIPGIPDASEAVPSADQQLPHTTDPDAPSEALEGLRSSGGRAQSDNGER